MKSLTSDDLLKPEQASFDIANACGPVQLGLATLGYASVVAAIVIAVASPSIMVIMSAAIAAFNGLVLVSMGSYLARLGRAVSSLLDLNLAIQRERLAAAKKTDVKL